MGGSMCSVVANGCSRDAAVLVQSTRDIPEDQRKAKADGSEGAAKIYATQFWLGLKFMEGVGVYLVRGAITDSA